MIDFIPVFIFATVVVSIISFAVVKIVNRSLDHKERMKLSHDEAHARTPERSADYQRLEERVRVLERIATDNGDDLTRQIEALRDVQEIEQLTQHREGTRS